MPEIPAHAAVPPVADASDDEAATGPGPDVERSAPSGGRRPRPALAVLLAVVAVVAVVAALAAGWALGRTTAGAGPDEASVDVGFLRDMADHHDQAVQLSLILLGNGEDPVLRGFATDTIATQRYEIGLMDARLADWGQGRGSVGREVMAWMGMPVPFERMPGLVSQEQLTRLTAAHGAEADRLFIELMVAHHQGGIHMAEYAWEHAETDAVRRLAETIAKVQRTEIRDLLLMRERVTG